MPVERKPLTAAGIQQLQVGYLAKQRPLMPPDVRSAFDRIAKKRKRKHAPR